MQIQVHKEGEFEFRFEEAQVNLVLLDYRLGINILDGDDSLRVVVATLCSVHMTPDGQAVMLDPPKASTELGALAMAVRFQQVRDVHVTNESVLKLEFGSGLTIEVPPSTDYEAWELGYPGGKIIAMPGGRLSVWGDLLDRNQTQPGFQRHQT